jgi:predicted ester cyclase
MTTEQTRDTMNGYAEALLSSGDFARYLAEDVTLTLVGTDRIVHGRAAARAFITFFHQQAFRTAIELKASVCDGSRAALEAVFVGTHIGEFEGVPASHRDVRVPYSAAYDLEGGHITNLRLYFPLDDLIRQISGVRAEFAQAR